MAVTKPAIASGCDVVGRERLGVGDRFLTGS